MTCIMKVRNDEGGKPKHPYDIGFWARIRGLEKAKCRNDEEREGWEYADSEIAAGIFCDDATKAAQDRQESKATSPTSTEGEG